MSGREFMETELSEMLRRMWLIVLLSYCAPVDGEIILHAAGYTLETFAANVPQFGDDLSVDSSGSVYVPASQQSNGIYRYDTAGNQTLWSAASGQSLVLDASGGGFLADRATDSIIRVNADGSFSTLVSGTHGLEWTWLALDPTGQLYANVWAGPGQGLYSIDRTTGAFTQLVSGPPGGSGIYRDMVWGPDGQLYTADGDGILRLDGSSFTPVAVVSGATGLTVDANGWLYTTTANAAGEVWRIDSGTGMTERIASGFSLPSGIAFDDLTSRLFVRDQESPRNITALSLAAIPEPSSVAFFIALSGTIGCFRIRTVVRRARSG